LVFNVAWLTGRHDPLNRKLDMPAEPVWACRREGKFFCPC